MLNTCYHFQSDKYQQVNRQALQRSIKQSALDRCQVRCQILPSTVDHHQLSASDFDLPIAVKCAVHLNQVRLWVVPWFFDRHQSLERVSKCLLMFLNFGDRFCELASVYDWLPLIGANCPWVWPFQSLPRILPIITECASQHCWASATPADFWRVLFSIADCTQVFVTSTEHYQLALRLLCIVKQLLVSFRIAKHFCQVPITG